MAPLGNSEPKVNDDDDGRSESEDGQKVWETPTIEELDYGKTEASYGVPGASEFGLYTN
jgi:hypothetical protein